MLESSNDKSQINYIMYQLLADKLGLESTCQSFTIEYCVNEYPKVTQTYYKPLGDDPLVKETSTKEILILSIFNKAYITDIKNKVKPELWDAWLKMYKAIHKLCKWDNKMIKECLESALCNFLKEEYLTEEHKSILRVKNTIDEVFKERENKNDN